MGALDKVITELQAATADLAADNDAADRRAKLEAIMKQNDFIYSHSPRVVRDYSTGKVFLKSGF